MPRDRHIMFLDFGTLYVSLERAINPRLQGRPVVVGGCASERGVVTGLSLEAKKAGVTIAMPVTQACGLCPGLVVIPGDHALYRDTARALSRHLYGYSPVGERVARDRYYLDLSGTQLLFGDAVDTGRRLKRDLQSRFSIAPTIGVARNKLVAKIASDSVSAGGICDITPGSEARFLAPLPVTRLPGVGIPVRKRLDDFNIKVLHDLTCAGRHFLTKAFGTRGFVLHAQAQGIDDSPVGNPPHPDTIVCDETLPRHSNDPCVLAHILEKLTILAGQGLRRNHLQTARIRVVVEYIDGVRRQKGSPLPEPDDADDAIRAIGQNLLLTLLKRRIAIKRISLTLCGLSQTTGQLSLLNNSRETERKHALVTAIDRIRSSYGSGALTTGHTLFQEWCINNNRKSESLR